MKGIVFNILERIITEHYGEDEWDRFLDLAGLEGAYTSLGNYEDAELTKLVESASTVMGNDIPACLRWVGREMLPHFETLYPGVLDPYQDTTGMLADLNGVIHPEVVKLYPGARVPVFHYHVIQPHCLVMEYDSPRGLCSLAHGLMLGAGDHFGDLVEIEHGECRHRGDSRCVFTVKVSSRDE